MKNLTKLLRPLGRACLFLAGLALFSHPALAQSNGGTIEGRVLNTSTGNYLTNARVVVEGTDLQAFPDQSGQYRLSNVPAGTAKVTVFYTGLAEQTQSVPVQA